MIPGIIPVGVTTPAFAYKEGFAGSVAAGGIVTINPVTPPSPYRWMIISSGCGQITSSSTTSMAYVVNSISVPTISTSFPNDYTGPSCASDAHAIAYIPTQTSFAIQFFNSGGLSMNYTIAILEIPISGLNYVAAGVFGASSSQTLSIPIYQNGIVLVGQFGQGGSGTWADMGFTFMTKIPVASPAQEALAVLYAPVTGTLSTTVTNNAAYNRIVLASTWKAV